MGGILCFLFFFILTYKNLFSFIFRFNWLSRDLLLAFILIEYKIIISLFLNLILIPLTIKIALTAFSALNN